MSKHAKKSVANCPSCAANIYFYTRPKLGDIVVCSECDEDLKVVRLNPIKLDWSLMGGDEDWADAVMDDYEDGYDRSDSYEWN